MCPGASADGVFGFGAARAEEVVGIVGPEVKMKGEVVVVGGVSLLVGFGSVVEDGGWKLNFGGKDGFSGSGLVVFGVPKTDDGVFELGDAKLKGVD